MHANLALLVGADAVRLRPMLALRLLLRPALMPCLLVALVFVRRLC